MSSSMRNAIQRRNHKERAQPHERRKFGLLEKRKDYLLRARDYKSKRAKLSALSAKARDRNPDEFRFAMLSSRTDKDGVRVAERPDSTPLQQEQVRVLKTQDAGYLRVQASQERGKIERLEQRLAFVGGGGGGGGGGGERPRHTVFVDDSRTARRLDPADYFGTHPELVDRGFNRLRKEQIGEVGMRLAGDAGSKERTKAARQRAQAYKELEARMKREKDLKAMERGLEVQRLRMGKGNTTTGNKWAKFRKR